MTAHSRARYQPLFDSQRRGVSTWPDEPPDEREFEPSANGDFVEAGMSYPTKTGRVEATKQHGAKCHLWPAVILRRWSSVQSDAMPTPFRFKTSKSRSPVVRTGSMDCGEYCETSAEPPFTRTTKAISCSPTWRCVTTPALVK